MLVGELAASGVDLYTANPQVRFDDPKVVEALGRAAERNKSGAAFSFSREPTWDQMLDTVIQGRAGFWTAYLDPITANQPLTYKAGLALLPAGGESQALWLPQSYVISAGTQSPQAAWRWVSFLSQQPAAIPSGLGSSYIPARKSIAESIGYWKALDPTDAAIVQSLVNQPYAAPRDSTLYYKNLALIETAIKAVSGGTAPEAAAREAQSQREEQVAQATPAPQPVVAPFVVESSKRAVAAASAAKITFSVLNNASRYEPLVKQFNQKNPDVFVELRAAPTTGTITVAELAQNSDCFLYWTPPQKADYSSLLDLQPLVDADASFPRNDFPQAALLLYRNDGRLYGLPQEINMPMLGYNSVAFEQAGIALPTANWTLDDFREAAAKLTTGEGETKQYGFASQGSNETLTFLQLSGVSPTTGSGEQIAPNFSDPKLVQAVRAYFDLLKASSPNKQLGGYSRGVVGEDTFSLQLAGRIGMWYQFSLNQGSSGLQENKQQYQPAVAPLPNSAALAGSDIGGNSLHISARTDHAQACWQWITFLSGQASAVEYGIPARLSVANSAAFLQAAPTGTVEIIKSYQNLATTPTTSQPWWQTDIDFFWFHRAVDRAFGGKDLENELDEAQRLTTDFLACVRTGATGPACAKQVDPEYSGWKNSGD